MLDDDDERMIQKRIRKQLYGSKFIIAAKIISFTSVWIVAIMTLSYHGCCSNKKTFVLGWHIQGLGVRQRRRNPMTMRQQQRSNNNIAFTQSISSSYFRKYLHCMNEPKNGFSTSSRGVTTTTTSLHLVSNTNEVINDNNNIPNNEHNMNEKNRRTVSSSSSSPLYLPSDVHKVNPITAVIAPMVAASDYPFRCLCRQYYNNIHDNNNPNDSSSKNININNRPVLLTFTQMLHARKIIREKKFCLNHFDFNEYNADSNDIPCLNRNLLIPSQLELLGDDGNGDNNFSSLQQQYEKGPLIVQLAGNDPNIVVSAAQKIIQDTDGQVHGFDLNCGCPQDIARKGKYGAHLMELNEMTVYTILTELRKELPDNISVSAKIRLPLDTSKLSNRICSLIDTGIDFLTIHGRTLKENKTRARECHLDQIQRAVVIANDYIGNKDNNFPIIANGGVETFGDVEKIRLMTGANAVMSSEAILETPSILAYDASTLTPHQLLVHQIQISLDYLQWCRLYPPVTGVVGDSMNIIRGHLFKFLFRYLSYNLELRNELAHYTKIRTIRQAEDFVNRLYEECCRKDLIEETLLVQASRRESSWYRRHWNAMYSERSTDMAQRQKQKDITTTATTTQNDECSIPIEERKAIIKLRIERLQKERIENGSKLCNDAA